MLSQRANRQYRRQFGQTLRAYRKARRLSQEALAERAELSGKFIGEVERGEKSISVDSLRLVAKALSVEARQLLP